MPNYAVCTYTYEYVPCDVADYITVTSYVTYIIAVMLRTIITGWIIMLGYGDYLILAWHCFVGVPLDL